MLGIVCSSLVDLFIRGVDVAYGLDMPELADTIYDEPSPAVTTIRVMLLVNLADLIARAKVGGYKSGGRRGCPRCKICGIKVGEDMEDEN